MTTMDMRLPDVGEGITEVEIVEWAVKPGDLIRADDLLAVVMTDKASVEIPSSVTGRVLDLACAEGENLAVGAVLARFENDMGDSSSAPGAGAMPVGTETSAPSQEAEPDRTTGVISPAQRRTEPLASPFVRARARTLGQDLSGIDGTGPEGRITEDDLEVAFAGPKVEAGAQTTPPDRIDKIAISGIRRRISERLTQAALVPQFTLVEEVDVTELENLRARMNEDRADRPRLTVLPFLIAALARAVASHPEMNAHFDPEASVISRFSSFHAGIATMTANGLMVPVLRQAEALSLRACAAQIDELAELARTGKARRDQLAGSTLTISSLGPLGGIMTTPILNLPEVVIIGVNKITTRPLWDGSQFLPRQVMNLSSSFDHRVIDGANAARFVQTLKRLIESPGLIFLDQ